MGGFASELVLAAPAACGEQEWNRDLGKHLSKSSHG